MNILAYGGGLNSTSLAVECVKRSMRLDLIIFADTGGEKPHTYAYLKTFSNWLVAQGMPPITRVQTNDINGTFITLEQKCLTGKALPSIAYGFKTCSDKHKIRPVDKYINNWPPAIAEWDEGKTITKLIGFDADEPQRAKDFNNAKYTNRYPLIEWDMGRDECEESIKSVGLVPPSKSSCFYCPSSKQGEIRELNALYPDLMRRALDMESNAELDSIKGLGRNFAWKDVIATDEMFPESYIDQACGCYDG